MDEIKHFGAPVAHVSDDRELDMARLGRVREEHMRQMPPADPVPMKTVMGHCVSAWRPSSWLGHWYLHCRSRGNPFDQYCDYDYYPCDYQYYCN